MPPLHFCSWPVSRILYCFIICERNQNSFHHLSCPDISAWIIRPTPRHRTSSPYRRYTWSFNPSGVRLQMLPPGPVSSYLTFSPFPLTNGSGRLFSVTLLYPHGYLPVRKDGALCCPDFP
jgi:hypothetical protein